MSNDLVTFLLARIAEDEAWAKATVSRKWNAVADFVEADDRDGELPNDLICEVDDWNRDIHGEPTRSRAAHIARWDPARVLAECAAKRAIVESVDVLTGGDKTYTERMRHSDVEDAQYVIARDILRHLALPYADHSDYRDEWRP